MNILEVKVSEVKDELFQKLLQKQCLSTGQFLGSFLMEMPTLWAHEQQVSQNFPHSCFLALLSCFYEDVIPQMTFIYEHYQNQTKETNVNPEVIHYHSLSQEPTISVIKPVYPVLSSFPQAHLNLQVLRGRRVHMA